MALKKRKILIPVAIIAFAIVVLMILGSMRPDPVQEGPQRLPVLVEYQEVEFETVQFEVLAQGNVMPRFQTQLAVEVSGRIVEVSPKFAAGGFFREGEELLKVDPFDYETALEEAKANLARAEAAVAEERARGQVAEAEWRSIEAGEAPELGLRRPQLASELANLRSAEARLSQAQRNLERTSVKAPFDGILQARNVNLGQFVPTNTVVGTLFGTNIAEIRLPLSDFDLSLINAPTGMLNPGDEQPEYPQVTLRAEVSGSAFEWHGELVRTEGVIDTGSRVTFGVVEIRDPYNRQSQQHAVPLTFGRFVHATIQGVEAGGLIRLPRYAVNSNHQVWIITDDRELQRKDVEVYRIARDTAYVTSGLESGEKVLLTQLDNPIPGLRVRLPEDVEPREREANDGGTE